MELRNQSFERPFRCLISQLQIYWPGLVRIWNDLLARIDMRKRVVLAASRKSIGTLLKID